MADRPAANVRRAERTLRDEVIAAVVTIIAVVLWAGVLHLFGK
jgi:hypothetical protein